MNYSRVLTFLIINIWLLFLAPSEEKQVYKSIPLTIGGIFPMNGSWSGGVACRPAVELALEMVNNQLDTLPQYNLTMQSNDSQVIQICIFIYLNTFLPLG